MEGAGWVAACLGVVTVAVGVFAVAKVAALEVQTVAEKVAEKEAEKEAEKDSCEAESGGARVGEK